MESTTPKVIAETPKKNYLEILNEEIRSGALELGRPASGLLLSGLSAGLDIGFSLLMMAVLLTFAGPTLGPLIERILLANMYAVGFIFVNLGRSELFTEHTTLMVFPVLNRNAGVLTLLRGWVLVYTGNMIGGAILASVVTFIGPRLHVVQPEVFARIAHPLVDLPWWAIVTSGILAGWMMGLLSWLAAATQDTISRIACVWLVTTAIGFAGLHHVVAGSVEVLSAVFSGQGVDAGGYGHFLIWTTLGNITGGMLFAILKFSHAVRVHEKLPGKEETDLGGTV